jgi:hypothetical protein
MLKILLAVIMMMIPMNGFAQKKKTPPPEHKELVQPEVDPKFCLSREDYMRFTGVYEINSVMAANTVNGERIIVSTLGRDGMLIIKFADNKFCLVYILHGFATNHDQIIRLYKFGQQQM